MDGQAKEARREREEAVAKAQMAAALNRGITWGLSEDAAEGAHLRSAPCRQPVQSQREQYPSI